jgi:DNA-binding Lrp family transcriptional regulator
LMERAYVFLKVLPEYKGAVIKNIKRIDGVKEAHLVLGMFDIVAKVDGPTIDDLEQVYFNVIGKLAGLAESRMHIVACPRTRK